MRPPSKALQRSRLKPLLKALKALTDGMLTEQSLLADRGVVEERTVNIPSVNAFQSRGFPAATNCEHRAALLPA
jgi:hypothetical protein